MGLLLREARRKLAGTPPEFIERTASDGEAALIGECEYREALARCTIGKPSKRDRERQRGICPHKKGNYVGCRERREYETDGDELSHGTSNVRPQARRGHSTGMQQRRPRAVAWRPFVRRVRRTAS